MNDLASGAPDGPARLRRCRVRQDRGRVVRPPSPRQAGRQVAVVVPTTLLARQHSSRPSRSAQGPARTIGQASRFVHFPLSSSAFNEGMPTVPSISVVGTHALLGQDREFSRSRPDHSSIRSTIFLVSVTRAPEGAARRGHVPTLSATSDPRTLQLSSHRGCVISR